MSGRFVFRQTFLEEKKEFSGAWNFGPGEEDFIEVETVVKGIKNRWDRFEYEIEDETDIFHEAVLLKLDCSKARTYIKWSPVWDFEKCLDVTVGWYKAFKESGELRGLRDLQEYIAAADKILPIGEFTK